MSPDAREAGDLDADRTVFRTDTGVVHLERDCMGLTDAINVRTTEAGTLWDDTEICRFCQSEIVNTPGNVAGEETLPTSTEVGD